MSKIVIDPITRIEGHLRIECEVDSDGVITDAWSIATMWRGLEEIVQNVDPREVWEYVQRICGVCTTTHALASVRAVEHALDMKIPANAQYIRNLILGAHTVHDHIVHFYQLSALDWVDITSALNADPNKASKILEGVSSWGLNSPQEFKRVQDKIKALVASKQLGIFANGYWGHPSMKLSPEINLIAVAHYLQALDVQRDANRIVAILGGKTPHIQNLAVGGVANAINLDGIGVLNLERLMYVKSFIDRLDDFMEQVYKVDVAVIAAHYPEWLQYGKASENYLCVPEFPMDDNNGSYQLKGGFISNNDLSTFREITSQSESYLLDGVEESSKHAWYKEDGPFKPWDGKTNPQYTGIEHDKKYTWSKAPTFYGKQVEVGPVARLLTGLATQDAGTIRHVNHISGIFRALTGNSIEPQHAFSTLGRILGRVVQACEYKDSLRVSYNALIENIGKGNITTFVKPEIDRSKVYKGAGFAEVPRGSLSHWIVIKDGVTSNYQAVVPTTWNGGPRNSDGVRSPFEQALIGTPMPDPKKPLEVLRTIHSFDPCMACAVHLVDADGNDVTQVKVL